ncbi:MAG: alpha/beta hydrolase [Candidatus Caldatribacteriaceae bacterium]
MPWEHTVVLQGSAVLLLFFLLLSYISFDNARGVFLRELKEEFAFSFSENETMRSTFAVFFGLQKPREGRAFLMPDSLLAEYAGAVVVSDIAYGPRESEKLDILVPLSIRSGEKPPVFVFVHGGAWIGGTKDEALYRHFAKEVIQSGYIFVSLDYRVYPRVKLSGIVDDVRQALVWLCEHVEEYGGERSFVVCGHSAGAQLVALLTVQDGLLPSEVSQSIKAVFLLSAPYDLPSYNEDLRLPFQELVRKMFLDLFEGSKNLKEISPVYQVEKTPIDFILAVGERDEVTPKEQTEALFQELRRQGNRARMFVLPGIGHGGTLFVLNEDFDREGIFVPIFRKLLKEMG